MDLKKVYKDRRTHKMNNTITTKQKVIEWLRSDAGQHLAITLPLAALVVGIAIWGMLTI